MMLAFFGLAGFFGSFLIYTVFVIWVSERHLYDSERQKVIKLLAKRRIREGLDVQDAYEKEAIERFEKGRMAL